MKNGFVGLMALGAVSLLVIVGGRPAAAEGSEDLEVSGEVEFYFEVGRTNWNGDYNQGQRGKKYWSSYFGDGQEEAYDLQLTRFKEAELKFKKNTKINDTWTMTNEIEIELKAVNANVKANDYDLEEASATFMNTSGLFIAVGILEDKKLYEGGLTLEAASADAKGFDEQPSFRIGYKIGDLTVDGRYHSIGLEESSGDFDKTVTQQLIRLQVEYKKKGAFKAIATFTTVSSNNKRNKNYQTAVSELEGDAASLDAYDAEGIDTYTVIGLGTVFDLDTILPSVTIEQWAADENDGANIYDTQIITLGITMQRLGPADLVLELELGSSDISGKAVASQVISAEYLWRIGKSKWGPGFKTFSNDADEALTGTILYGGGEWKF